MRTVTKHCRLIPECMLSLSSETNFQIFLSLLKYDTERCKRLTSVDSKPCNENGTVPTSHFTPLENGHFQNT